jgi:hypothetical protein
MCNSIGIYCNCKEKSHSYEADSLLLAEKLSVFLRTFMFIAPSQPCILCISFKAILPRMYFPRGVFASGFQTDILYAFYIFILTSCSTLLILFNFIILIISDGKYKL